MSQLARKVDVIYDALDDLLLAGKPEEAAAFIRALDWEDEPLPVLLSALIISLPWIDELGQVRRDLVEAVRRRAVAIGGPSKADACLKGLE